MEASKIKIKCSGTGCGRTFRDMNGLVRHAKRCECVRRDLGRAMVRAQENEKRPKKRRKLVQMMEEAEESRNRNRKREKQQHGQCAVGACRSNERTAEVSFCDVLFFLY